jgi:hypothetical protein
MDAPHPQPVFSIKPSGFRGGFSIGQPVFR